MSFEAFDLFANITIATIAIPFFLGLIIIHKLTIPLKLLLALVGVSLAFDVLPFFYDWHILRNYAGNIYRLAEFAILFTLYYKILKIKHPVWFWAIGIACVLLFVANMLFLQRAAINSYSQVSSALVFIGLSIAFFYQLMKDLPELQIHRLPMFWVNTAILIYFAGNLFVFTLTNYLVNTLNDNLVVYWSFHNFLSIIKNLLFATGLWQHLRTLR